LDAADTYAVLPPSGLNYGSETSAVSRYGVFGGGDLKLFLGLVLFAGPKTSFYSFYFSLLAALPLFTIYILRTG
jgi:hypothetical protein